MKAPGDLYVLLPKALAARLGADKDFRAMKRRTTSDEERKLFEQNFREARPLKPAQPKRAAKAKRPAQAPAASMAHTQDRLRRGLLEPGRPHRSAWHDPGARRIAPCSLAAPPPSTRLRLVLVVTGKGNPKNDENAPWMMSPHGVLKQMVPRWLNEPELAALIAGVAARPYQTWRRGRALCLFAESRMKQAFHTVTVATTGRAFTSSPTRRRSFVQGAKIANGLLTCFIRHTSASLLIQENADPDVQKDLQDFFAWLARAACASATPPKGRTTCPRISAPR